MKLKLTKERLKQIIKEAIDEVGFGQNPTTSETAADPDIMEENKLKCIEECTERYIGRERQDCYKQCDRTDVSSPDPHVSKGEKFAGSNQRWGTQRNFEEGKNRNGNSPPRSTKDKIKSPCNCKDSKK